MAIRSLIRERFFPHLWCPGCGHGHVLNAMLHSVDDLGYDPSSLVMVSGIGCSARMMLSRQVVTWLRPRVSW